MPFPSGKMAECRGLAPHARERALVSTEARHLGRLTFQIRLRDGANKIGTHGTIRTCTCDVLNVVPLLLGYGSLKTWKGCRHLERANSRSNRQPAYPLAETNTPEFGSEKNGTA